jgi:hypothetical protein
MLPREVDAALGRCDRLVEPRLLAGVEQSERAPRELVVVPHVGGPDLELLGHLRVDEGDVLEGLGDPVARGERSPALGVLRPGVARQEHAAAGLAPVVRVIALPRDAEPPLVRFRPDPSHAAPPRGHALAGAIIRLRQHTAPKGAP